MRRVGWAAREMEAVVRKVETVAVEQRTLSQEIPEEREGLMVATEHGRKHDSLVQIARGRGGQKEEEGAVLLELEQNTEEGAVLLELEQNTKEEGAVLPELEQNTNSSLWKQVPETP